MTVESLEIGGTLPDTELLAWIDREIRQEMDRIQKEQHTKTIPMPVKRMSILADYSRNPQKPSAINLVELCTNFNFDLIKEIMVSEIKVCPVREGFSYIHVLLFTDKPIPLILPYLYKTQMVTEEGLPVRNKLNDWQFTNGRGQKSRHIVRAYHK